LELKGRFLFFDVITAGGRIVDQQHGYLVELGWLQRKGQWRSVVVERDSKQPHASADLFE
jgi:hypothetical protein